MTRSARKQGLGNRLGTLPSRITRTVGLFVLASTCLAAAAEYYVSPRGEDSSDGLTRTGAFATIQRGVDALQPGDVLSILPGEYRGAVSRADLGSNDADTIIRAEVPGTVFVRGDVPAPEFQRLEGSRNVYVADFDGKAEIPSIQEIDTLSILVRKPNPRELEFTPGAFFHDAQAGKLYLSTTDREPAESHRYSVSVVYTHGIYLLEAKRVIIEGLGVTGFNGLKVYPSRDGAHGGTWGIFLSNSKSCVIRDCHVWLNGWGIGINSQGEMAGDNLIERCWAWGNNSLFASGDSGGLTLFKARRDTIKDSVSFLNGRYGINIYNTGTGKGRYGDPNLPGNDEANKSRLVNNLAWGQFCDIKIKAGEYFHTVEGSVSPGYWSVNPSKTSHSLIGHFGETSSEEKSQGNIELAKFPDLDLAAEFADPENHDYRLQSNSRFRGAGPEGSDLGPFPFEANVYFVAESGDDAADGLSVKTAWRTLERAAEALEAGDTLYLLPGTYQGGFTLAIVGTESRPISIRGRGSKPALIDGRLLLSECQNVVFDRVDFAAAVGLAGGRDLAFRNCRFLSTSIGLRLDQTEGVRVEQSVFSGFEQAAIATGPGPETTPPSEPEPTGLQKWIEPLRSIFRSSKEMSAAIPNAGLFLQGNRFENSGPAPALILQDVEELLYSGYNGYEDPLLAWRIGDRNLSLEAAKAAGAQGSVALAAHGAEASLGRNHGPYRVKPISQELRIVQEPTVHSVGATTANIEWTSSLPAKSRIAWGESKDCPNELTFEGNGFTTYSLTGLQPGKTYYFCIRSMETPAKVAETSEAQQIEVGGPPLSFTTLPTLAPPRNLYVATSGDDSNTGEARDQAWRTLQHAAAEARPGDTVWIAGGRYSETVRIRVSGEPGAPITFRASPGEQVILDGSESSLQQAFVVGGKHFLRFDGFRIEDFNLFPKQTWIHFHAGAFHLYASSDLQITRCFSDGRGGFEAIFVAAWDVSGLLIKNCVATNSMSGAVFINNCPGLVVENCVIARPMIGALHVRNAPDEPALFRNNIITDMMQKKASLNHPLVIVDGYTDSFRMDNNCFVLQCFPPGERVLLYNKTPQEAEEFITHSLFTDPGFAVVKALIRARRDLGDFPVEMLMDPEIKLDFDSFFASNPDVIDRDIGLQPAAFSDFSFLSSKQPQPPSDN